MKNAEVSAFKRYAKRKCHKNFRRNQAIKRYRQKESLLEMGMLWLFKGNQNPVTCLCTPYDVVICIKEYRAYFQVGIAKLTLTSQNVYYPLRKACLTINNPEFDKDTLINCPSYVGQQLKDVHKNYLKCFIVKY